MKKPIVVGLGEILWDVFDGQKKLGGAPANFAYHASQQGADGIAVSAIGKDVLGAEIVSALAGKNFRAEFLRTAQPTGTVQISLDAHGVASYDFAPDCAWDNLQMTPQLAELARETAAVCFGSLAQRGERSRAAIHDFLKKVPANALKIFDVNLRQNFFSEQTIRDSLALANALKINEDELGVLEKFFCENALAQSDFATRRERFFEKIFETFPSVNLQILTCGGAGSYVATRAGDFSFVAADSETKIVDTVGAGDSFTATFAMSLLRGESIFAAHRHATDVANFVCTQHGAMPEIPQTLLAAETLS